MVKYRNYIYLTIAEASIESFKKTNYSTYSNYCKNIWESINTKRLSPSEASDLVQFFKLVESFYGLTFDEAGVYVIDYFKLVNHSEFEKVILMTKKHFPFIGV